MTCKHENADHLMPGEQILWPGSKIDGFVALVEQFRCVDCGEYLSLGVANDNAYGVWIEIRLADHLADRDWPIDPRITWNDHEEALIEIASELPSAPRARSPIEMMVDQACGVPPSPHGTLSEAQMAGLVQRMMKAASAS